MKEGVSQKERGGRGREGKSFLLLRFYNLTTADTDICTLALYDRTRFGRSRPQHVAV